MSDTPGGTRRFWLALGVVVLALVLILRSDASKAFLDGMIRWAEAIMNTHPVWGGIVFLLLSALSAMLAFTSSVVLVPPATLAWGRSVTFLLLWGGWMLGAAAAFGIGRSARPLLMRLGHTEKLKRYQEFASTRMKFWMVLVFCIAVPSEIPGYLFGGLRYPFVKFLLAIGTAEAIYALGTIVAGDKLLEAKTGTLVLILAAMAGVAATAGYVVRRMQKRKIDSAATPRKQESP